MQQLPKDPRRIAVLTGALSLEESVRLTVFLQRLAHFYPVARIDLISPEPVAALLGRAPYLDRVVPLGRGRHIVDYFLSFHSLRRLLKKGKFPLAFFVAEGFLHRLTAIAAGVPVRVCIRKGLFTPGGTRKMDRSGSFSGDLFSLFPEEAVLRPSVPHPESGASFMARLGVPADRPPVFLAVGKVSPAAASSLSGALAGMEGFGSGIRYLLPREGRALLDHIPPGRVFLLPRRLTFVETARLLDETVFSLGTDPGVLLLAGAMGLKGYRLAGDPEPGDNIPPVPGAETLEKLLRGAIGGKDARTR